MTRGLVAHLLVALLALAACDGGERGATSGLSGGPSDDPCARACARCHADPCDNCALYTNLWRPEYRDALFACVADAAEACSSARWEQCSSDSAKRAPPRDGDAAYRDACLAKRLDCGDATFVGELCATSAVLSSEWLESARECTTRSCADVGPCLRAIFEPGG